MIYRGCHVEHTAALISLANDAPEEVVAEVTALDRGERILGQTVVGHTGPLLLG